jgi:hypothetical protein
MARDINKARRSVGVSLILRQECVIQDVLSLIKEYNIDLKKGTGEIGALMEDDAMFRTEALKTFYQGSGLHIDVNTAMNAGGFSKAFHRIAQLDYHAAYYGHLNNAKERNDD